MPPKKRKLTGWTRRGCVTCKRRQKKCDEGRPRCKNCTRLNLQCEAFDVFQVVGPADLARHSSSLQNSDALGIEPKTAESEPPRANEQTSIESPTGDAVEELSVPSTSSSTSQHTNVRQSATSPPGSGGFELGADFNWDDHFSDLPVWGGSPLFSVRSDSPEEIREVTSYSRASPQLDQQYISRFPTVSQTEVFLLNHYFDKLCPILVNVDSPANPLKSVLIPRALTSAMLLHSVCAISACHFANTKNESGPETRQVAIAFYTKAVRALNTALADDTSASNADRSIFDILLLTAVFICKYQITKGSISKWRPLLKGVQQMLETFDANLMPETRSYVESFVVYHTTVASVLDMVYFPTAPKSALWNEETARSRSVDPYMGLSSDHISLLERTSALYRWSASVEDERSSLFAELRQIIFDMETLSSTVPGREDHGLSEATQAGIQSVAKAYQYAIWVWMHSVIEHMASARRHQLSMYDKGLAKAGLAMSKEQAISKCLAAILDIPYGQPCEAALVFLLFVLGCETDNVAEWEVIFTRLKALEGNLQIGNVRRVREFLEVVRDSKSSPDGEHDWQVLLEQRHWDLILS